MSVAHRRLYAGPLPGAESPLDRPLLRYPTQWGERPTRCPHCGAGLANHETHPPHGLVRSGETTCLLCSRTVCRWRDDGTRPLPKSVRTPGTTPGRRTLGERGTWSEAHARCIDCGTTERPHKARGRCTSCCNRHYQQAIRERRHQAGRRAGVFR